jgi:integrase
LPQEAVEALRIHRKRQLEEPHKVGANWQDYGLVFASSKGTPLDAKNIVNRRFKHLLKRAGIRDIRWHDLHHTYATLLLSRGVHPKYVQQSLGHTSIQLTLESYSYWIPSMGRHAADSMDEALRKSLLLTKPPTPTSKSFHFYGFCR